MVQRHHWQLWLLYCWLVLSGSNLAIAQSIPHVMTTKGHRGRDVLQVSSEVHLGELQIHVTSTVFCVLGNSRADRDLEIIVFCHPYRGQGTSYACRYPVHLAQGQKSVSVEFSFPVADEQMYWSMGVEEDGWDIEARANANFTNIQLANSQSFGSQVLKIVSNSESPDEDNFFGVPVTLSTVANQRNMFGGMAIRANTSVPLSSFEASLQSLNSDWKRYLNFKAVYVELETLEDIAKTNSPALEALHTFVAAGGALVIESELQASHLQRIDALLLGTSSQEDSMFQWGGEFDRMIKPATTEDAPISQWKYRTRNYLNGKILAVSSSGAANGNLALELQQLVGASNLSSAGQSYDGGWYWKNLITTVGKPPVWVFATLICVFGAVIGPGLLYFTARAKRRTLLVFLVPLLAGVATLLVLLYGVLHEGFETHTKITSVVRATREGNRAFGWSRHNYFSGAPLRAIPLDPDAYFRPVQLSDDNNFRMVNPTSRKVDYTILEMENNTFLSGWLGPRQQQQILVGKPESEVLLPIEVIVESGQMTIKNLTSETLPFVIAHDKDDAYFWAEEIGPQSSVIAESHVLVDAGVQVARLMVDLAPASPAELQAVNSLFNMSMSSRNMIAYSQESDIINSATRSYYSERLEMPPRTFATLLRQTPYIEPVIPVDNAEHLTLFIGEF